MTPRPLVMVVEDDKEANRLQQELLAAHGLESVAVFTGAEAIDVCEQSPPDAVLLDLMLPGMDGFETCRRIRQVNGRRLPIVILTTLDSEDHRKRGLEAGADAFFSKPFDPDEVIGALRNLLAH